MIRVFVVDRNYNPMNPIHPAEARILLKERKAKIYRAQPFCIRLGAVSLRTVYGLQLKLDPGSITTGIALVNNTNRHVVWGAELIHHGKLIKKKMEKRAIQRRSRRNRKTRYREARFLNRTKSKGWLPPSLMHRVNNVMTVVRRICKLACVNGISLELAKFDTQSMQTPDIAGVLYQQGELAGYEIREYLLEKYSRTCVYCGAKNIPLQIEHVIPRALGGTDRVSNLVIACNECNTSKGKQRIEEYLKDKPLILKKIKTQMKTPLKDAAMMNATRWELWRQITATGKLVECGTGAMTKFNRVKQNLPKEHWIDACCVGKNTPKLQPIKITPLFIKSYGRGSRQVWQTDSYGFPKREKSKKKEKYGFRTGDLVKAVVLRGKRMGVHIGRVITTAYGYFNIDQVNGIHFRYLKLLQRNDGYGYSYSKKDIAVNN